MHENLSASDQGTAKEVTEIQVFQSGGLVAFTKKLAYETNQAHNQQDEACFATATILTAAAALEAIFVEFALIEKLVTYPQVAHAAGAPRKYLILKGKKLSDDHSDADRLWKCRNAISHSEPDHERSRHYGERINKQGAMWAANTIVAVAQTIWGADMPDWFRRDADL